MWCEGLLPIPHIFSSMRNYAATAVNIRNFYFWKLLLIPPTHSCQSFSFNTHFKFIVYYFLFSFVTSDLSVIPHCALKRRPACLCHVCRMVGRAYSLEHSNSPGNLHTYTHIGPERAFSCKFLPPPKPRFVYQWWSFFFSLFSLTPFPFSIVYDLSA